ncbi:MAG: sigma-70 family RNA polymerase sigma factor [Candidatus Omnitrophica bacterium]|nr:sigma-70 family RNA polymerase sigma factor [Candidatus Omnitrophota bacterium]
MDPVKSYLKDIKNIPLLTAEEEVQLGRRVKKGDKAAREKMIRSNLRLVISIAKRYVNLGISLSDLIEEGNIGLMRGVDKFDPEKGFRFSTYAAWWIKQGISRAIIDQGKMIRVPVYLNEEILKYRKLIERMTHQMRRRPSPTEIARKMKVTIDRVKELENAITKMSSLDAPLGEGGDGQMIDILEDESLVAPDEAVESFLNKERARALLDSLDSRERTIIEMRYGLTDGENHTLSQIANKLGLSRERVRQIEELTISKLKQTLKEQENPKD